MSDKLEQVMIAPLAAIEAIEQQTDLDASGFSLEVCERILNTHTGSDCRTLNPVRAQQAKIINKSLIELIDGPFDNCKIVKICPSMITSGMLISHQGYIGKVVAVDRYETVRGYNGKDSLEPFVYLVKMIYVSGDLSMHKYFTARINNGCDQGYLSTQQGNRGATFYKVIED